MFSLWLTIAAFSSVSAWTRYEKRILSCPSDSLTCTLEFPGKWNKTIECRTEDIPEKERTALNKKAKHRVACPLGCRPHIVQKETGNNRKCASFQTFGKYQDEMKDEWYIWFCEPCQSVFTTNCDFQE